MFVHQSSVSRTSSLPFDLADAEERRRRNEAAIRLLDDWTGDESGYDEQAWPAVREGLDRERRRTGSRPLFARE
jgi:hypothetical protein